jgi:putative endonuclease
MYVTYALYSASFNKIYIGYTSSLIDRFHSHNFHSTKGFTSKFRPWIVVYVEFYDSKTEAMKREKELKSSRGRDFIRKQVEHVGLLSVS